MAEPRYICSSYPPLSAMVPFVIYILANGTIRGLKAQTDYRNIILEIWHTSSLERHSSLLCHVQVTNRILHFRITSFSQQWTGRPHSFPFSPPLRFGLLAISEASSNIKIEASRLTSLEFWLVCNIWLTYWTGRERRLFCFRLACLPFGRVMILASVFWSVAPSGGKIENSAKVLPPLCQSCFYYTSHTLTWKLGS